jgi:hypothetical protein
MVRVCQKSDFGGSISHPGRDAWALFVIANPEGEAIQGVTGVWIASPSGVALSKTVFWHTLTATWPRIMGVTCFVYYDSGVQSLSLNLFP